MSEMTNLGMEMRGSLLQRVHFHDVMEGYDLGLGTDGVLTSQSHAPIATIRVRKKTHEHKVSLVARVTGVKVDDRIAKIGVEIPLIDGATVVSGPLKLKYLWLGDQRRKGWPYLAALRIETPHAVEIPAEGPITIGREDGSDVQLPDKRGDMNIVWREGVTAGDQVATRRGAMPRSAFSTDSIMVASNHVLIERAQGLTIRSCARNCYTFIRSKSKAASLKAATKSAGLFGSVPQVQSIKALPPLSKSETVLSIHVGDEIMVGNHLFRLTSNSLGQESTTAAPEPAPQAVAPAPAPPPAPHSSSSLLDVPSAAPPPVHFEMGPDTFMVDRKKLREFVMKAETALDQAQAEMPAPRVPPVNFDATALPDTAPPPVHFEMGPDTFMAQPAQLRAFLEQAEAALDGSSMNEVEVPKVTTMGHLVADSVDHDDSGKGPALVPESSLSTDLPPDPTDINALPPPSVTTTDMGPDSFITERSEVLDALKAEDEESPS